MHQYSQLLPCRQQKFTFSFSRHGIFRNFYKLGNTHKSMKRSTLIIFGVAALLVQILPVWWFTVLYSIWFFIVEALLEGGLFRGSLEISRVFLTAVFSIYAILALISPVWSFFSLRGQASEMMLSREMKVLLTINIITIVISLILIILNKGIVPDI